MNDYKVLGYMASLFSQFLYNPPKEEEWEKIKKAGILLEWFIHSDDSNSLKGNEFWKDSHFQENYLDLATDYVDLFICDEICLKAPPYGSFYLDVAGELYSEESDRVKEFYIRSSFFTKALLEQPADFIAIELEFLSMLLYNVDKDEVYKKVLKNFLEENFLPWVTVWAEDTKNNAKSNFYKGLGAHMKNFCDLLSKEFCIANIEKKVFRKVS
ncbi:TorD/DmsD family molecular chaperone [Halarcobacter anaerophilus]|uniref:TorD/DmsD family molecular chaperone n=1 Tax=Halarcobacter anaerophilus TaxID=877500 RepID=UPI0005CB39D4|nr:molecular chaperone TorD family protein [Halarcobacter anaerophilus]